MLRRIENEKREIKKGSGDGRFKWVTYENRLYIVILNLEIMINYCVRKIILSDASIL